MGSGAGEPTQVQESQRRSPSNPVYSVLQLDLQTSTEPETYNGGKQVDVHQAARSQNLTIPTTAPEFGGTSTRSAG